MPYKKKQTRFVDIGFGKGELLRAAVKKGWKAEGIELSTARKVRIPGAKLRYTGFDKWLSKRPNSSCEIINAGLFLGSLFEDIKMELRKNPKIHRISDAEKRKKAINEILEPSFIQGLVRMKSKLVPGGQLRLVLIKNFEQKHMEYLRKAGFSSIRLVGEVNKKNSQTFWEKKHIRNQSRSMVIVTARRAGAAVRNEGKN